MFSKCSRPPFSQPSTSGCQGCCRPTCPPAGWCAPSATSTRSSTCPGVRLTAYGAAADLPPRLLQDFPDDVAARTAAVPVGRVYLFEEIVQAHADMEANGVSGQLFVNT
jgi:hypothetical protein